jgi:hypothetical protein
MEWWYKCGEIDEKISRYQNILRSISDQPTIKGAKRFIAKAMKPISPNVFG